MNAVQAEIPELSALNSTSSVAFYRLLKRMWAQLVQLVEANWDGLVVKVDTLLNDKRAGSTGWYAQRALEFQLGDSVAVIDGRIGYETLSLEKRIVVQAACIEDLVSGRLLLKVVKNLGMNLTASEMEAFRAYMTEVKFAGVIVDVISSQADQIKVSATVEYDRQVLAANGALLENAAKFPVVEAIRAYLARLPFNSEVSWTGLTDYMQKVAGVKDFVVTATEIAPYATNAFVPFQREVASYAGHCTLVGSGTITYV